MSETRAVYQLARPIGGRTRRGTGTAAARLNVPCDSAEFWLPLPPVKCGPNGSHGHWAAKAAAIREYRAECGYMIPRATEPFRKAVISVTFYLGPAKGRYHPRDSGNAISSAKALVDSIVDRGWLADDGAKYLSWGAVRLLTAGEHGGRSGIAVRLERQA